MKDGILIFCNYIREVWGRCHGIYYPPFAVSVAKEKEMTVLLPVLLLLVAVGIYLYVELVRSRNIWMYMLLFVFLGIIWCCVPKCSLWILAAVVFVLLTFFLWACRRGLPETWQSTVLRILLLLLISAGCTWGVVNSQLSVSMHQMAARVSEKLRYGIGKDSLLPEGDFTELGAKVLSNQVALKIAMSQPQSYYLRGFVGTHYTGDGFVPSSPEETYEYEKLKYQLLLTGFCPENQLSLADRVIHGQQEENQIKIQIKEASSRYLYTPYELSSDLLENDSIKENRDMTYVSQKLLGVDSYGMSAVENQTGNYLELARDYEEFAKNGESQYQIAESYYNVSVYEEELELPENVRRLLEEELGTWDKSADSHFPYYEAKKSILEYLNQNIEYDTSVGNRGAEQDFLHGFLRTARKGYDIQFAAAATLMYRYYGIPARYVEGYLITPQDAKGVEAYQTMEIGGRNAHAWVEIYQDGIGWIPIEVTPPYLTVMEQPSDITVAVGSSTGESDGGSSAQKVKPEEHESHRVQEPEKDSVWQRLLAVISLAVLIAGITVLLLWAKKRRDQRKSLENSFCLQDRSSAVCNLYRAHRKAFPELPAVVEKAAFSLSGVTEEEYQAFYQQCKASTKAVQ